MIDYYEQLTQEEQEAITEVVQADLPFGAEIRQTDGQASVWERVPDCDEASAVSERIF